MPDATFLSQFSVKIGGRNASEAFMNDVLEIVVDTSLYLPEMFTILVQDSELEWVDNTALLDLGKPVEISAEGAEQIGGHGGLLIKGEITALEPNFSVGGGTTLLIRGYNKSHRLHRGKKSRTFLKMRDSDVVSKIAGEVGLSPAVDSTNITYDYIIQSNQTNMEFLQERAGRIGYQAFAAEGKLYFKKGEANLGQGPTLGMVTEEGAADVRLHHFRPVLAATHQVDKIKVQGWDAKQKKPITAEVAPNGAMNQGGIGKTGGEVAKEAFGAAEKILVNQPLSTPDEAKALAEGLANDLSSEFIQAEGVSLGHPGSKPVIRLRSMGWVIGLRENILSPQPRIFSTSRGMKLILASAVANRTPSATYLGVNSGSSPAQNGQSGLGQASGVAPAIVTNNSDPEDLGRVKVQIPWLGEDIESDWIRVSSPGAGAERGLSYLPEVGDETLIAFEHGNVHRPYVLGGLWNSKDKPNAPNSKAVGGGKVNQRLITSRTGHIILLDDTDGAEQIVIRDKTGNNELVIDSPSNTMTIKLDKDCVLNVKNQIDVDSVSDIMLDSKGNITIKSTGNTTVESTGNLNLEAKANVTIKGIQVTVQGTAKAEVTAPTVSLAGSALAEVKGALVKIN